MQVKTLTWIAVALNGPHASSRRPLVLATGSSTKTTRPRGRAGKRPAGSSWWSGPGRRLLLVAVVGGGVAPLLLRVVTLLVLLLLVLVVGGQAGPIWCMSMHSWASCVGRWLLVVGCWLVDGLGPSATEQQAN
jgi:hypothetical protein